MLGDLLEKVLFITLVAFFLGLLASVGYLIKLIYESLMS